LIQKKTNSIVFDNDAKGCYDRIIIGIAHLSIRRLGYSKNSVKMLGKLWEQLEHHIITGFGVSDISYSSTVEKLLYGIGQGSLLIANFVGTLESVDTISPRREIRVYHIGLSG
jgi:hypothetical protein